MPVYEYKCQEGHRFEKIEKYADKTDKCPQCGSQCERMISPVNFTFGFTYSEKSYIKGNEMELVRNV